MLKNININNYKDGYHLNSTYWQNYKKRLPALPQECFEIAIGMILGDASIYKVSCQAYIKFEQGYKQKDFIDNLFIIFKNYCFMESYKARFYKNNIEHNIVTQAKEKSFCFKTFSYESFTKIYFLFYKVNKKHRVTKKSISKNLVIDYLSARGLTYWIMCDGSLQNDKKTIILHTQAFSKKENLILSRELNVKFKLNTKVIAHKCKYYVIKTSVKDAFSIYQLIKPYIIPSMAYKLPVIKT